MIPNRQRPEWESQGATAAERFSPASLKDSRKAVRYSLEIDVLYSWTERGVARTGRGRTRDISPKGAFVVGEARPPLGAAVTMNFSMPALGGESRPMQVQRESQVLRIDARRAGQGGGFSVAHVRAARGSR